MFTRPNSTTGERNSTMSTLHKALHLMVITLAAAMLFTGCDPDDDGRGGNGSGDEPSIDGPTGSVELHVTAPNGSTPLVGATVSVIGYESLQAETDSTGLAELPQVPVGEVALAIAKGPYYCELVLEVEEGLTTTDQFSIPADSVKMAVVLGAWDSIELVLERLGFSYFSGAYDIILANDLASEEVVARYDVIFINCGVPLDNSRNADVQANLRSHVESGGYLYVSDWSSTYVDEIWPEAIQFVSPDAQIGYEGTVRGDIVDSELAAAMGTDEMDITFDLGAWVVIDSVGVGTRVHVQGDVQTEQGPMSDRPLTVSFTPGDGKVIYTSFHNEAQTTSDMDHILEFIVLGL